MRSLLQCQREFSQSITKTTITATVKKGGYNFTTAYSLTTVLARLPVIRTQIEHDELSIGISDINIQYIEKTIDFLQSHSKRVILIRRPMHTSYLGYRNDSIFNEIRKQRFSKIEFLDFSRFPLVEGEFVDLEHLNNKGSARFSKWFDGLLDKGILDSTNVESIVASEIDALLINHNSEKNGTDR